MKKRIILFVLIFLNLGAIFFFSHQDAKTSKAVSNAVSRQIEVRVPDYEQKNLGEKNILHADLQSFLRKLAHIFLFCTLGIFLLLFVDTFLKQRYFSVVYTEGIGLLIALGDEFHQSFIPGRTAEWSDVGFDIVGITIGIVVMLSLSFCCHIYKKIKTVTS